MKKYVPLTADLKSVMNMIIRGNKIFYGRANFGSSQDHYELLCFDGERVFYNDGDNRIGVNINKILTSLYCEEEYSLADLISIKPRICRVWTSIGDKRITLVLYYENGSHYPYITKFGSYTNAELLTDDEIKQFLNDEGK